MLKFHVYNQMNLLMLHHRLVQMLWNVVVIYLAISHLSKKFLKKKKKKKKIK